MIDIIGRSQSGISAMDLGRIQDLQRTIQDEESDLDRKLMAAQQNFAKLNGFRIKKNRLQKKIDNM